jgi:Leucine-rich repeat (LRR) protein
LSDNQLTEVPADLSRMKKLQTLYIDSNNIDQFFLDTSDPRSYQNIENIYIGFNPIKSIPENIKNLELAMLSISGCKYLELNKAFTTLSTISSLEHLEMGYLNLDTLPWQVVNLYGLHVLDLSGNPAMEWDTSIWFLSQHKSLEEIILKDNRLTTIPMAFQRFENLQSLDLSYNDRLSLRQVLDVTKNIEKLHSLDLSYCKIREVPASIGDHKKMWDLYLNNNELTQVPPEIGGMEQLEVLDLSYNSLLELPEEFGALQSLERLKLTHNPLEFLPRNLTNLVDLKYLELPKNSLDKEVKKSLKKMFPNTIIVLVKENPDDEDND